MEAALYEECEAAARLISSMNREGEVKQEGKRRWGLVWRRRLHYYYYYDQERWGWGGDTPNAGAGSSSVLHRVPQLDLDVEA